MSSTDQTKLYVGNLNWKTADQDLIDFFNQYVAEGNAVNATVIMDRETNRSRGFAFVSFQTNDEAKAALAADGQSLQGRPLRVNVAKSREDSRR